MKNGKLITFEGCEGVGKSTQVRLLRQYLEEQGVPCLFTREPGGTLTGERIRTILKDESLGCMAAETELLLFEAARADNTKNIVIPALNEGKLVVIDRYIDSTVAYQAYGRGLALEKVKRLNEFAMCGVKIDVTIFLDAPPFANTSRKASDRMELVGEDFHSRVYAGFKELCRREKRIASVKTHEDLNDTAAEILRILRRRGVLA